MRVSNELRKLFRLKAIWVIYIILVIFVLLNNKDYNVRGYKDFANQFIANHGSGPYSVELINDYINFNTEINDVRCRGEKFTFVDCDGFLSTRSKELRNLYSSLTYHELYNGLQPFESDSVQDNKEWINTLFQKNDAENKNLLEEFFFQKVMEYHYKNPRINDIDKGIVYHLYLYNSFDLSSYIIFGGAISVLMMILSISNLLTNDSVDKIILTSKTGRKIINYKFISCLIWSVCISAICLAPLILLGIKQNDWNLFYNSKMIESSIKHLYWYDLRFWHYLLFAFIMSVIANVFISILIFVICVFSKKVINMIAYNLLIIASVIGLIYYLSLRWPLNMFLQVIQIILYHTPFGFLYNNIQMFEYSYYYPISYLTYREFPIVFMFLNAFFSVLLIVFSFKHYKKMNL